MAGMTICFDGLEMIEKLNHCPFCGEKPYTQITSTIFDMIVVSVVCGGKDCGTTAQKTISRPDFAETIIAMNDVAKMWNDIGKVADHFGWLDKEENES